MKKQNSMLRAARLKKSWTSEFVSGQVGVSLHTYLRWESGVQTPRPSSLHALCEVFEMSAEDLGFADFFTSGKRLTDAKSHARAKQHEERAGLSAAAEVDYEAEQPELKESLSYFALGITSCWQLYMTGGQSDLERLLPMYFANLTRPTLSPGPDQKTAASLLSQVYQLSALLELQRGDFLAAQSNGTQALVYSQLAKDWNVYVAAQLRMAAIFMARKRIGSALSAYNDALKRVNLGNEAISPILHSWTFAGLAEIQAMMGRDADALQILQLAFTVFPDQPQNDPCFSYTQCDRSMLILYEGLVFLRLGQPKLAWEAFAEVDGLKPPPPERMRAEFLKQKAYTSLILGNMVQSCIYLEAAAKAAQEISSDLALSDVYALYEHMLANWGQETRVKSLARLFQS